MPKYLIKTGSEKHPPIERKYMTLQEAGIAYSNMWAPVILEDDVMEDDGSVRKITEEERQKIIDIADDYDSSK